MHYSVNNEPFVHPAPPSEIFAARRRVPDRGAARQGGASSGCRRRRSPSTGTCSRRSCSTTRRASAGVNPILGCEVYVAPGDRRTKSGTPGETANHLVLLAETKEGYHNLIKLVSSGYTEGFYYKPRIDKALLAQHSKGLIGLSSCLKGEVATGHPDRAAAEGARRGGRLSRHPRARQLLPRDAVPGHRRTADRQRRAFSRSRSDLGPAAGRHQRRPLPAEHRLQAARHPALHRHRENRQRRRPAALPRRPVLPEVRRGDGAGLRRLSRGDAAIPCASPSAATSTSPATVNHLPNFDVPDGFTPRRVLRAHRPPGFRDAAAAAAGAGGQRRSSSTRSTSTNAASPTKSR